MKWVNTSKIWVSITLVGKFCGIRQSSHYLEFYTMKKFCTDRREISPTVSKFGALSKSITAARVLSSDSLG